LRTSRAAGFVARAAVHRARLVEPLVHPCLQDAAHVDVASVEELYD